MHRRAGARALTPQRLPPLLAACLLGASSASAKTCPNASTSTVSGKPSYTYTRGCIISFDGTAIVYNLFEPLHPAAHSVYPILEGPGWGSAGDTSPDPQLIAAGYAELTWDPRGFGQSGGVAEVDAPYAEGRDVSALIDQVLTGRPEIAVDRGGQGGQPHYGNDHRGSNTYGEPVVGMTGGSYGGGIQFATAAFDNRVKAIVPVITWNNLNYSLWPGNVIKLGWGELLYGAGFGEGAAEHAQGDLQGAPSGGDGGVQIGGYDPNIHYSEVTGAALGYPDHTMLGWFGQRSMAVYGAGPAGHVPDVPTLLDQGTVDTLFNLNDAWNNYVEIKGHYPTLPVKLIAFCGGHVSCPTGAPPRAPTTATPPRPRARWRRASRPAPSREPDDRLVQPLPPRRTGQPPTGCLVSTTSSTRTRTGTSTGFPRSRRRSSPGPATYVTAPLSGTLVDHGVPTGAGPAGRGHRGHRRGDELERSRPGDGARVHAPAKRGSPIVGIGHVSATSRSTAPRPTCSSG